MAPQRDEEAAAFNEHETSSLLPKMAKYDTSKPVKVTTVTHGTDKLGFPVHDKKPARYLQLIGAAYMIAMGVCGIVLVALGSTLSDLAANCGTTSTAVGTVFIARGCGAVLGAISSSRLYKWFRGNSVMTVVLAGLSCVLLYMPTITSVVTLHVAFFGLGLCTAVTDTGCQIMTRKVHGKQAGPWLGANTVAFGLSGALVPLISYITGDLFAQYAILATVGFCGSILLLAAPAPEKQPWFNAEGPNRPKPMARAPIADNFDEGRASFLRRYKTEMTIGCMVFCLIGGKVGATAYLTEYVKETNVINSDNSTLLICVLWVAITIGRLAGIQDQRTMDLPKLYNHSTYLFMFGAAAALAVIVMPTNGTLLWVCVGLYGLFNGPTVGYCYDLNNRITVPTETGMSVVMFGLNFGASFVPYGIAYLWDWLGNPQVLFVVLFLSHLVPYPLMLLAKRQHENNVLV